MLNFDGEVDLDVDANVKCEQSIKELTRFLTRHTDCTERAACGRSDTAQQRSCSESLSLIPADLLLNSLASQMLTTTACSLCVIQTLKLTSNKKALQ